MKNIHDKHRSRTISLFDFFEKGKLSVAFGFIGGLLFFAKAPVNAQPETLASSSFLVNIGIGPQTANNVLKPYGLTYGLTKNYEVPVKWSIEPGKAKHCVLAGQGPTRLSRRCPATVPVYATIHTAVRRTLDSGNGKIAGHFIKMAGVPTTAYVWEDPQNLGGWNDTFIMPRPVPTTAMHYTSIQAAEHLYNPATTWRLLPLAPWACHFSTTSRVSGDDELSVIGFSASNELVDDVISSKNATSAGTSAG